MKGYVPAILGSAVAAAGLAVAVCSNWALALSQRGSLQWAVVALVEHYRVCSVLALAAGVIGPLVAFEFTSRTTTLAHWAAAICAGLTGVLLATEANPWSLSPLRNLAAASEQSLRFTLMPIWPLAVWPLVSSVALGAAVGSVYALMLREGVLKKARGGAVIGGMLGLTCAAASLTASLAIMASGHSFVAAVASTLLSTSLLLVSLTVAWRAWGSEAAPRVARYCPLLVAVVGSGLVLAITYGSAAFLAVDKYHSDPAYTYLHFTSQGTWRRTIGREGNAAKLWRCQRFLATYPYSVYRPAALLKTAECQLELWKPEEAAATLDQLSRDYPCLSGYPEALRAICEAAAGRRLSHTGGKDPRSFFTLWSRNQGGLIAARAAERAGQPHRALGYYATHTEYLRARGGTAWSQATLEFAEARADKLLHSMRSRSTPCSSAGTVSLRLSAGGKPIRDCRVALVQPHRDAALPADSAQFTGAWSIPAWYGVWAVSDWQGNVVIKDVPYGDYEVVIGLSLWQSLKGYVFAKAIPVVSVHTPLTRLPDIKLHPAIELVSPTPGEATTSGVELRWRRYPKAVQYAVTLVVVEQPRSASARRPRPIRATCWTRAGIAKCRTTVDRSHFAAGYSRLERGARYMWMVYAYDRKGRLLSSSEHYHDLQEPTFTIQ